MTTSRLLILLALGLYLAWCFYDPFDPKELKDKRVVVCGASTGIGEEIAYLYAKMGARIVLAARRQSALEEVLKRCVELGAGQVEIFVGDLSLKNTSKGLIEFADTKLDGIDHLILNHMVVYYTEWRSDSDLDYAAKLMQVNFISYMNLATFAMPALERSRGTIAAVSSAAGLFPSPYTHVYSASKHALQGFFHAVRLDMMLYKSNVSISVIPLGLFGTASAKGYGGRKIPSFLQFFGDPADAAYAIARAATLKLRESCYPVFSTKLIEALYLLFPQVMDQVYLTTFRSTITIPGASEYWIKDK